MNNAKNILDTSNHKSDSFIVNETITMTKQKLFIPV